MSDGLAESSTAAIEAGSQSFAAAARLFDPRTRNDAVLLYAWCRHCDDVIDGQVLGHGAEAFDAEQQRARLLEIERQTDLALESDAPVEPSFEALRRVVRANAIDHRYPRDLLRGFAMDVDRRSYETIEDLLLYCYHVAGVVGIMMAKIMGVRDEDALDRACDLGIAFQLTNIARDIVDDARAGRCYVPAAMLRDVGINRIDPENRGQRKDLAQVAVRLLDQAEVYYRSAYAGLSELPPRSAWAIAAALRVYRAIGREVRRRGPGAWDGRRAGTGRARKLALMALATTDVAATRFRRPGRGRHGLFNRGAVPAPDGGEARPCSA